MKRIKLTYEESHKNINGTLFKYCNRCKEWFPCTDEYFYKVKTSPDGLFPYCKECNITKSKERHEENHKEYKQYLQNRLNIGSNREIKNQQSHMWRDQNAEWKKQYQSQWQQDNKDKIIQYGENRSNKKHDITEDEWTKCKIYFNNTCAYCGISETDAKEQQGQYFHKEHVIHNGENDLSNCVPSCKSCNSKKWEYDLEDWYNEKNPNFNLERLDKIHKWINDDYKNYIK